MKEISQRVVILNKLESPYISEAIIILKDSCCLTQSRAVEEAEKVVRAYLERSAIKKYPTKTNVKSGKNEPPQRRARFSSKKHFIVGFLMCLTAALIAFVVTAVVVGQ